MKENAESQNNTPIFQHKTLEERALEFNGKLGPYEEADWRNPEGREVW